jgi:enamine deaminase RidA (YjgF/YER057c/UK114 family)
LLLWCYFYAENQLFIQNMLTADQKFEALGLNLPPAPAPKGVYKPCLVHQGHLYVSGHGPCLPNGELLCGRLGEQVDQEYAKNAAQQTGLAILATIKAQLGSFDKIKRVVKILGMVNATPTFDNHPYVINGCSELFEAIWGTECGVGVRSAVGMGSLPQNITVEIEALFELH